IFNTALEEAVLSGKVDFATCSFKDVESELPGGVSAVPVLEREDHRDVLVSRHGVGLDRLPQGALLATSSPRRVSQLRAFRQDFRFQPLRGNITSRVTRDVEKFDGVVLAAAGVRRLELHDKVTDWIGEDVLLPAPAQGALGCEYQTGREDIQHMISLLVHPPTLQCVEAEKAFLVRMSGGCYAPIGALAALENGRLRLRCRVVSLDGRTRVEEEAQGEDWPTVVEQLAQKAIQKGADVIVRETRQTIVESKPRAPAKK
ncbi:MAG: hydroxymethylbilane synthase, partial [Deltaproteobacteria bacterium]|nr:hydroxymethylbilane synthase [Deltaproteobacteria bacterium]